MSWNSAYVGGSGAKMAAVALILLGACAHPGLGGLGGGGVVPPPPPPPPAFTLDDLMGDWVGQLVPDAAGRRTENLYLRFASEQLVECADSAGNEWTLTNSERRFVFHGGGRLEAEMGLLVGAASLALEMRMDESLAVLEGTYQLVGPDLFPVRGSLTLTRSAPGAYDLEMLAGKWSGTAEKPGGSGQGLELELDAAGALVDGRIVRRNGSTRRTFSAGAGSFAFFDDSLGRLEDVVIVADNGMSSTFHYLLLDPDGTLLAGPGTDEVLGAGIVRLQPAK